MQESGASEAYVYSCLKITQKVQIKKIFAVLLV
jgi:hypothetical protein